MYDYQCGVALALGMTAWSLEAAQCLRGGFTVLYMPTTIVMPSRAAAAVGSASSVGLVGWGTVGVDPDDVAWLQAWAEVLLLPTGLGKRDPGGVQGSGADMAAPIWPRRALGLGRGSGLVEHIILRSPYPTTMSPVFWKGHPLQV